MTFPSSASSVGHFVRHPAPGAQYFLRVNHGNGQPGAADHFSGRVGARDHASRRDCTQPRTLPRIRATKSRKRPDLRAVNMTNPPHPAANGGARRRIEAAHVEAGSRAADRGRELGSGPRASESPHFARPESGDLRVRGMVALLCDVPARRAVIVGKTWADAIHLRLIRARKNPPTCTSRRGDHWRWRRDLNPRLGVTQHSLSRRAPSAARTRHRERTYRSAPPADKSPGHGDSAQRNGPPRHAVARS